MTTIKTSTDLKFVKCAFSFAKLTLAPDVTFSISEMIFIIYLAAGDRNMFTIMSLATISMLWWVLRGSTRRKRTVVAIYQIHLTCTTEYFVVFYLYFSNIHIPIYRFRMNIFFCIQFEELAFFTIIQKHGLGYVVESKHCIIQINLYANTLIMVL